MMDIVLASKNAKKRAELAAILTDAAPSLRLVDADWHDVDETGDTFEANAHLKAVAVHEATGLLAIADDSGLEVDAIGGEPGVHSARYAGEQARTDEQDDANLRRVLERLRDAGDRRGRFRCAIAVYGPLGDDFLEFCVDAAVEGTIRRAPAGEGGFGYDPIFEPLGWDVTFAEVPPAEKAAISHRGRALRKAVRLLGDVLDRIEN